MSRTALVPTRTSTSVTKGNLLHLASDPTVEIGCESGSLWITQDNDTRDIVLKAGERFASDRPGAVLVYALEPAVVTTTRKAGGRAPSVWDAVLRRVRHAVIARQPALS